MALEAGDYEDAVTYLESALDAGDAELESAILKNLIIAYEYSGDFESAYDTAKQFLADYSDEEIEREYEFLETRVGDDIEASTDDSEDAEEADESETDADTSAEEEESSDET